jgi:hypothetical protein
MTDGPAITTQRIRFALSQLRAQNGHHEFEELCWHLARLRITPNILFATGPVAKGGDTCCRPKSTKTDLTGSVHR